MYRLLTKKKTDRRIQYRNWGNAKWLQVATMKESITLAELTILSPQFPTVM
jgi:hypothetical protein